MRTGTSSESLLVLCLLLAGSGPFLPAAAQGGGHEHHSANASPPAESPESREIYLPDIEVVDQDGRANRFDSDLVRGKKVALQQYLGNPVLLDQDGREHRFYSDLLQGKTVVMDFIFTRCSGVCPVISRTFARIQEHLGERLGKDVHLLSFSVDPTYDTPARLKEYAARFGARPGWLFLTGAQAEVEAVLRKLGQGVQAPEQHQNLFILGNERTGLWKKAFGLAPAEDLFAIVDSVADDRGEGR